MLFRTARVLVFLLAIFIQCGRISQAEMTASVAFAPAGTQITSLALAEGVLLTTPVSSQFRSNINFIDFFDLQGDTGEGRGIFSNDLPFPGNTIDDDNDFAMLCTGYLMIAQPGER